MLCPCGSQLEYSDCCEPYLNGDRHAPTPEALMRSRYTAHVVINVPYIRDTLAPEKRDEFDEKSVREWATDSEWLGLRIVASSDDGRRGKVEFVAKFKADEKTWEHREAAKFRKDSSNNRWYFVDGKGKVKEEGSEPNRPLRTGPKIGRNEPCPCGSGKKYKKCCGS